MTTEASQNTADTIAERITGFFWRNGKLSVAGLARAIHVDRSVLSLKLNGRRRWYLDELQAVAALFGTSVAYLTGETDDPQPLKRRIPASDETGIVGL